MNKIKSDKILFDDDDFLIKFDKNHLFDNQNDDVFDENLNMESEQIDVLNNEETEEIPQETQIEEVNEILENAQNEADEIIKKAKNEAQKILENAQNEADETLNAAKQEASGLLTSSKEELENLQTQAAKQGYEEGHKDGLEKIQEELEEKIENFSKFIGQNFEIKEKILKSASKDILDIIINISEKILLKNIDSQSIDKIIKSTIQKLEKKEDITIITSEKYAKLLFELQNKKLEDDDDNTETSKNKFNFEDFKQYENFKLVYNPKYADDTIIVENLKERFDASIKSQLDVIVREIFDKTKNAQLDLSDYIDSQNEIKKEE